jgi:hypothetical protein
MNFIYISATNRERGPALFRYMSSNYPQHKHRSAGVNEYFCKQAKTNLVTVNDFTSADIVVCMEYIHYKWLMEILQLHETSGVWKTKVAIVLRAGDFSPGTGSGDDWLMKIEDKLAYYLAIESTKDFPHKILDNPHIFDK